MTGTLPDVQIYRMDQKSDTPFNFQVNMKPYLQNTRLHFV